MGSAPLNYRSLIREAAAIPAPWEGIHPGTDIGHIHLQVSDLARSENFYHHVLGLDITQRNYPGALFLSAGGYHHHLGLNIWNSRGASPSSSGHAGLISFELKIPGKAAREALLNRLEVAQVRMEAPLGFEDSSRTIVYDPDSIRISV
jgi:catechol 2,3-dioxygenase